MLKFIYADYAVIQFVTILTILIIMCIFSYFYRLDCVVLGVFEMALSKLSAYTYGRMRQWMDGRVDTCNAMALLGRHINIIDSNYC